MEINTESHEIYENQRQIIKNHWNTMPNHKKPIENPPPIIENQWKSRPKQKKSLKPLPNHTKPIEIDTESQEIIENTFQIIKNQ